MWRNLQLVLCSSANGSKRENWRYDTNLKVIAYGLQLWLLIMKTSFSHLSWSLYSALNILFHPMSIEAFLEKQKINNLDCFQLPKWELKRNNMEWFAKHWGSKLGNPAHGVSKGWWGNPPVNHVTGKRIGWLGLGLAEDLTPQSKKGSSSLTLVN